MERFLKAHICHLKMYLLCCGSGCVMSALMMQAKWQVSAEKVLFNTFDIFGKYNLVNTIELVSK